MTAPVLTVSNLVKHFPASGGRKVHAVNDVSFNIRPGETLGMVGESGSGKSTIGRLVTRLIAPTAGKIVFDGRDVSALTEKAFRPLRRDIQVVFQDPWSALNPRLAARTLIEEPMKLHLDLSARERRDKAEHIANRVRLSPALLDRYPSELSGGQMQRVCIARAIATNPKLIVLDEPTSSLDLSVRAGILELLHNLRSETNAAFLFITHDLGTLKLISNRIVVLYLGRIVESGATATLFEMPRHPYTQALLSAHLPADPSVKLQRQILQGEIPSPINLPPGCGFASRCPIAEPACRSQLPTLDSVAAGHAAACLRLSDTRTTHAAAS
ncbi:MAG: ABC transporter ATP-binding protein [Gammaproteobacteria bacterium]|nr:ABC transporter ATP-binding protein [Gammaproteobacteria bacterium]